MNDISKIVELVEDYLLGDNSFPVRIREKREIKQDEFEILKKSIEKLCDYYKEEDFIPKRIALCFVDISNFFFVPNLSYSESEIERFEDYGIALSELGNKLFSKQSIL
ncbi:hypothetical protein [Tenacibaculum maritimum]|uniref:hypothetical protein n=1 Tax=Tenacibaculum maritimum TaxID=107401 RepID=UPI003875B6BE